LQLKIVAFGFSVQVKRVSFMPATPASVLENVAIRGVPIWDTKCFGGIM